MRVKLWGTRGSVPAPGSRTARYGGNTSCAQVTLGDGTTIVLDAGTGIRPLGLALDASRGPIHILLTHLHVDHIQGLLFFAPLFERDADVTVWGPPSSRSLESRIGRYLSAPLAPVEVRELPAGPAFRACPAPEWTIGSRLRKAPPPLVAVNTSPIDGSDTAAATTSPSTSAAIDTDQRG